MKSNQWVYVKTHSSQRTHPKGTSLSTHPCWGAILGRFRPLLGPSLGHSQGSCPESVGMPTPTTMIWPPMDSLSFFSVVSCSMHDTEAKTCSVINGYPDCRLTWVFPSLLHNPDASSIHFMGFEHATTNADILLARLCPDGLLRQNCRENVPERRCKVRETDYRLLFLDVGSKIEM